MEIEVDEAWDLTREVVERITIESRIVEMDVEETETLQSDTLRETVDVNGVTETHLIRRQTIDEEMVVRKETRAVSPTRRD